MKCSRCGSIITDNNRFCTECGAKLGQELKTVQLRCNSCGGVLMVDTNRKVLSCPYCGSNELLIENDTVVIQRIKSNTHKEIELERIRSEEEREKREIERERKQKEDARTDRFVNSKLSVVSVLVTIVCAITAFNQFTNSRILAGLIAIIQVALFSAYWLMGLGIIKEKIRNLHIVFGIVGVISIFLFFKVAGMYSNEPSPITRTNDLYVEDKKEVYTWPKVGINSVIPQPKSNKGHIIDSADSFYVWVSDTSEQDYFEYIDACISKGFTEEVERESENYSAYNLDGYRVSIQYYSTFNEMDIELDAPLADGNYKWPKSDIAKLIPQPKSTTGSIKWEAYYGFVLYVGDTSIDDFNEYVDACAAQGFDVEYRRGDKYYYADNTDGFHLSLKYEGHNTMFIRLDDPDH